MGKLSGLKFISVIIILGINLITVNAQSDSTTLLTYKEYLGNILTDGQIENNHSEFKIF